MTNQAPVSQQARAKARELLNFVANPQEPTVWTAQRMTTPEIFTTLITVAGQFHQNEIEPETVLGALLMAAAWIAAHEPKETPAH